ncbi:MAG: BcII family subclass B1 metallo-beta-lactamase [Synoicihabitans sp.]
MPKVFLRHALFAILTICFGTTSPIAAEPAKEMEITALAEGVFLHRSYKDVEGWGRVDSNGLIVVIESDAYLIDTPWPEEDTAALLAWIEQRGLTLQGAISTHSHDDRTAGIAALNAAGIPTYASKVTNEILAENGKAQATHAFPGPRFTWVHGHIEAFYPGGGHTLDNVVVWLPRQRILAGGCFVRSLASTGLGYTGEASIGAWPASTRNVKAAFPKAQIIVPGHGAIGDFRLLDHTEELAAEAARKLP